MSPNRKVAPAFLALAFPICAQVQGTFVQFTNGQDGYPSLIPATVPTNCYNVPPSTFSQQRSDQWKLYCPNGGAPRNTGVISGSGTGACPTVLGGNLGVCPDPGNANAPTFSPIATVSGGQWNMYEKIGSAYLQYNESSLPPFSWYTCGAPSTTQGSIQTAAPPVFCDCYPTNSACQKTSLSPIVIDVTGEGFFMTDKAHGVEFRKDGPSALQQMSWTDPAHHNAWLARPNADGSITSIAQNLFGNLSPQDSSAAPNGYAALAYAATQAGCGKVTKLDAKSCPAVWSQLRLWHDANQDGIAQTDELSTLDSAGIEGISLNAHEADYTDQYGNQFRYTSQTFDASGNGNDRCYDVWLLL